MTITIPCAVCNNPLHFQVCSKTLIIIYETLHCSNPSCLKPVDEEDEQRILDLASSEALAQEIDKLREERKYGKL